MKMHNVRVADHSEASGGYRVLTVTCSALAKAVKPGQFIHLQIPRLDSAVLRRPFSVYRVRENELAVLYKTVGRGTDMMRSIKDGEILSMIGPLGNGFPAVKRGTVPVLVAGGYGVAPLAFLAERSRQKGIVFIGGARSSDLLCVKDFKASGWGVRVATEDGSAGDKGLVTKILDKWLSDATHKESCEFFACGPDGMLKAVAGRAKNLGCKAWLSLDKHMGCGLGACLACVQRVRRNGTLSLVRVCRDGPVFEASEIVWE